MITDKIQPETTLVVDWSKPMGTAPGTFMMEYDTSTKPFKKWRGDDSPFKKKNLWIDTKHDSIQTIEMMGGDVVWVMK